MPIPAAIAVLLLGVCVGLTAVQTTHWRQSTWLWEWTLENTEKKKNWVAFNNLGSSYLNAPQVGETHLKLAEKEFDEALKINSRHAKAIHNRGLIRMLQGNYDAAISDFENAYNIDPKMVMVANNWGLALARQGKLDEAIDKYRQALKLDPENVVAHTRLGIALFWRNHPGDREQAIMSFRKAVQLTPTTSSCHANLAWALHATGQEKEARGEYELALRYPRWIEAVENDAWHWATSLDEKRRDWREAVRLAEQICQASEPDARRLDILAAAYARAGRFDEARNTARLALSLAESDRVQEIEERLARYKKREAYQQQATSATP